MQIEVLGRLVVCANGVPLTPTSPAARQVLALLAAHADQGVTETTLINEVWQSRRPRSARTMLQVLIDQLRGLISRALRHGREAGEPAQGRPRHTARDILVTVPGGYLINSCGGVVDAVEFERGAGAGYRAMETGDIAGAAARLRGVLSLWTGPAFDGEPTGPHLRAEIRRLDAARLAALDQWAEAELLLGRHRELVVELAVMGHVYRTQETLHAHLMVALHRSGLRGEALAVYDRLREALMKKHGTEPSDRLRRMRHVIARDTVVRQEPHGERGLPV